MSASRGRLVVVWLAFGVLLAGIIVHEVTDLFDPKPQPHSGRIPMFPFSEPELSRVEVMYAGRFATLIRNAEGDWFQHDARHGHHRDHRHGETDEGREKSELAPADPPHAHPHPADRAQSALIAERMALMARMLADRRVRPTQRLEHYGLANPKTMMAFYGRQGKGVEASQPLAVLSVGDLLPTQYAYYAMRAGDKDLSLIPRYYIALLLALVFGEEQVPTPLPVREEASGN